MKYFIAVALLAVVASATVLSPAQVSVELPEIQRILSAINNPHTSPSTIDLLKRRLLNLLLKIIRPEPEPVAVGPTVPALDLEAILAAINDPSTDPATAALLEQLLQETFGISRPEPINPEPIVVAPPLVDFPEGDGGALSPIETAPVVVPPVVSAPSSPSSSAPLVQIILNINAETGAVVGTPVVSAPAVLPETVSVVESAPETVSVVETAPESVSVVDNAPGIAVLPALPSPAIVLPGLLNRP